jgi:hypothetical protein
MNASIRMPTFVVQRVVNPFVKNHGSQPPCPISTYVHSSFCKCQILEAAVIFTLAIQHYDIDFYHHKLKIQHQYIKCSLPFFL